MNDFGKFMSRLLALTIFAFVIFDLPFIAESFLQILIHEAFLYSIPLVLIFLLPIIMAIFILIKPASFSRLFHLNFDTQIKIELQTVLHVALVCMGVFISLYATVYLLQESFKFAFIKNELSQGIEQAVISAEKKSELASYIFELVLGIVLIFTSKPLTRKLIG